MRIDKAQLALLVLGIVTLSELALCGVLAGLGISIPDQAWALVYTTLGLLGGVAGAQYLNGRVARS